MNLLCLLRIHEWFNQFIPTSDGTIVTGICLRCGKQKKKVRIYLDVGADGFPLYYIKADKKPVEELMK